MHKLISTRGPGLKERAVYMYTASNVVLVTLQIDLLFVPALVNKKINNNNLKKSHTKSQHWLKKSQLDYFPKSLTHTFDHQRFLLGGTNENDIDSAHTFQARSPSAGY